MDGAWRARFVNRNGPVRVAPAVERGRRGRGAERSHGEEEAGQRLGQADTTVARDGDRERDREDAAAEGGRKKNREKGKGLKREGIKVRKSWKEFQGARKSERRRRGYRSVSGRVGQFAV